MPSLIDYKGLSVVDTAATPGASAINDDFIDMADRIGPCNYGASAAPTGDNDSVDTAGLGIRFYVGSRWFYGTAIYDCVDDTPGAAVWVASGSAAVPTLEAVTTAGATTDQAVTLSGGAVLAGSALLFASSEYGGGYAQDDGTGLGGINLVGGTSSSGTGNITLNTGGVLSMTGTGGVNIVGGSEGGGNITITQIGYNTLQISSYYMSLVAEAGVQLQGSNLNMGTGGGSGGGTLNLDNGVISAASLMQLAPQSSPPAPVAGGIYFDGSHLYGCLDGATWTVIV